MGGFGGGGLSWTAGVGQADLATGGQGAAGLAGLLGQQPTTVRRRKEPLVDLAVVEGAGGDQVVEVAGRLPQLPVALADRSGGDPGELLGQRRPGVAFPRAVGGGRERVWTRWPLELPGLQPLQHGRWHLGEWGVQVAAGDPLVEVAGAMPAGWGHHIAAPAPPVHLLEVAGTDVAQAGRGQIEMPPTSTGADQRPRTRQAMGG
jgi:hypothetical protein